MAISIDFGTCNTVAARWNPAEDRVQLIEVPELSREFACKRPGSPDDRPASVIPSLIHYANNRTFRLGAQVDREGLVNLPETFRWLKLDVLRKNKSTRRVGDRRVSHLEAATQLFEYVLTFVLGSLGGNKDEDLILTVPVEAYDHYTDWISGAAVKVFPGRVQMLDEATACILGYREGVRDADIFLIFDFGGGTLDVSIVKTDFEADSSKKCKILGRAGEEIGGMLVDRWMLEHLAKKEGLGDEDLKAMGTALLEDVENAKIALSSGERTADITRFNDVRNKLVSSDFSRKELLDLLDERNFRQTVARTVDRALENALDKYGTRKSEIKAVLTTGGTSLLAGVPEILHTLFPDIRVCAEKPFDAVASGACRYAEEGVGGAALIHDYCLMGWNGELKEFEEIPIIPKGTDYPTQKPVCGIYITPAAMETDALELIVYERSDIVSPEAAMEVDENGRVRMVAKGNSRKNRIRPLNPENREFLFPDPVCSRDENKRFVAGFGIDENKRLTLSLKDNRPGSRSYIKVASGEKIYLPVRNFPLVRL